MISRNVPGIVILLLILLPGGFPAAEIQVDITMPVLGDGMGELESLLAAHIGAAVSEVETMINQTLYKPEITGATGNAAGLSNSLIIQGMLPLSSRISLSVGGYAALYSHTFDKKILLDQFENLQPEDDFEFGVSIRGINTNITWPLDFLLPGLTLLGSLGYGNLSSDDYYFKDLSAHLALGYPFFKILKMGEVFRWTPLHVLTGGGVGITQLGATLKAGVIAESFPFDPDGGGPLLAQDVNVEMDPVFDIGLESRVGTLSLAVSSGISFFDFLNFYLGSGVNFTWGTTGVSIKTGEEILVTGYLSGLIEEPGYLAISGTAGGEDFRRVMVYLFGGLAAEMSSLTVSIPVLYNPAGGLSAGLTMGIVL